ncbi:MAG TPA: DUF2079 domain-containing protein [Dongiaceae bacterium]|nr:DUF2079 domain-containing protein [Dongiaceae bacterium]
MTPRRDQAAPRLGVVRGGGSRSPVGLAGWDRAASPWSGAVAVALALVWTIVFTALCAGKLRAFLYDDFDLALFAQAIHGVLRGSFASSIRGMPWLADHSSLVLVPLAPLAALVPAPLLLVTLQAAALASGAVVVHRLARRELGSPLAALALAAAWLLQPALAYVALFEFHPETLAVPALLLVWDAWRAGRRTRMTLAAVFALLCKEDVAFVVLGLALVAVLVRRRRGVPDALALGLPAIAVSAVTFLVLKPMARGVVDYGRLYAAWGATPRAALVAMITHPLHVLGSMVGTAGDPADSTAKLVLWVQTLGPWLFAPLAAPVVWLPAAPAFAEHLLSDRIEQHVIVYQYASLMLPWLAAGCVATLAWLTRAPRGARAPVSDARVVVATLPILVAAALAQWVWGPFTAGPHVMPVARPQRVFPNGTDRAMRPWRESLVRRVGAVDGVVSGFETLQRFYRGVNVISAHHVLGGVYTFSDVPYPTPHGIHAALLDTGGTTLMDDIDSDSPDRWQTMARTNRLVPVAAHGDLTLWLAAARDTLTLVGPGPVAAPLPHPISFEERLRLLGARLPVEPVAAGDELPLVTSWQRHDDLDGIIEIGLALQPLAGDDTGTKRAVHSRFLGYGLWSVDDWTTDVVMNERYRWVLPDDLPAGTYRVEIAVASRTDKGLHPFMTDVRPDADGFFDLGRVVVTAPRSRR